MEAVIDIIITKVVDRMISSNPTDKIPTEEKSFKYPEHLNIEQT